MKEKDGLVVNGREVEAAVEAVDVADELADSPLELGAVAQAGLSDLDEDNLAAPLGVALEQLLKRLELLDDALGDVELLAADNDLLTGVERTEGGDLGSDTGAVAGGSKWDKAADSAASDDEEASERDAPVLDDALAIDADRAVADGGDGSVGVDAGRRRLKAADANAR